MYTLLSVFWFTCKNMLFFFSFVHFIYVLFTWIHMDGIKCIVRCFEDKTHTHTQQTRSAAHDLDKNLNKIKRKYV